MPAYADHILSTHDEHAVGSSNTQKATFAAQLPKEDVVISGMSGRFPECRSVKEFEENLYSGVDMITDNDRRWPAGLFGLPRRSGKLAALNEFDATFFNVPPKQAHCMDPQLRILLEVCYEAIYDAGVHPNSLRGRRIGVYVGTSGSETDHILTENPDNISGYEMTGCCRAMFANRISFALDFKGPSFAVDTACSSSMVAFDSAWKAISEGEIEGAIVAGCQVNLKPQTSLQFNRLSMLADDGRCKAFDASGNGYVRSEAVGAVFLQRCPDAQRVYAHVVNTQCNTDGFKTDGITFPSGAVQRDLLNEVYRTAGVDPSCISYIEAHGTGTKVGDPQEVNAIDEVFCRDRKEPLLIGSVKSNMGHSEPASGICSIIKVLLAMKNKRIPGNLHFNQPNPNIAAINEGRMKVVCENTPWRGMYAGINSFGFGGSNVHVLLRAPSSLTNSEMLMAEEMENGTIKEEEEDEIPRLVVYSGRTENNVSNVLTEFKSNMNGHFASLLDNISDEDSSAVSFPFRGYTVVGGKSGMDVFEVCDTPHERTPLWLIFSGMGSQWVGCGSRLMELPPFANAIQKCRVALLPFGIDLLDIITREEPNPMKSTTASFTAIAAVQVGLVEVLRAVGLTEFDGYIGHSVGELGCGYADGTLTAEQTVLAAYWRGRAVEEAGLPVGAMAAVGLGAEEAEKWCHTDGSNIVVACHNSASSVTISGLKDEVEHLTQKFDAEGIFCRGVMSGNIAFHHPTLRKAAPRLLTELQKVILSPVRRSAKWISSSFPESKWETGLARKASAEYLVNNLVSPVLFAEALAKIPPNARVVEVAPHALMQAVLRRALPQGKMIPLVRKESKDSLTHLLQALGKLFASGEKLRLAALYPHEVKPVPLSTPCIASLIEWDHSVDWTVADYASLTSSKEFKVDINLNESEHSYLQGHTIDGRVLFPATGYLVLAWKALAKLVDAEWDSLPVTFSDVVLHEATVLSTSNKGVNFLVRILPKKGEFEVIAGDTVAASGKIHVGAKETPERNVLQEIMSKGTDRKRELMLLTHSEAYKELRLRGYQYGGIFRGIKKANLDGTTGELMWKSNWVSLLDTMLQFSLLGSSTRGLYLPTRIRKVIVEPAKFIEKLLVADKDGDDNIAEVNHNSHIGITTCPGIEIYGLKATMAPRRAPSDEPLLENYFFVPNFLKTTDKMYERISDREAVRLLTDLIIENVQSLKVKISHKNLKGQETSSKQIDAADLAVHIANVFTLYPLLALEYSLSLGDKTEAKDKLATIQNAGIDVVDEINHSTISKLHLMVITNSDTKLEDFSLVSHLEPGSFILVDSTLMRENLLNIGYNEVASIEKLNLTLLKKPKLDNQYELFAIPEADVEFNWIENLKEKLADEKTSPLWLLSKGEPSTGLLGMFKCLKKEPTGQRLRCVVDPNNITEANSALWQKIMDSDLAVNIIQDGTLGTMRHLHLPELDAKPAEHSYLNVLTRGDLASLTWLKASLPAPEKNRDTILCHVKYAPLNFRDIMLASGKLPPDALPGDLAQKECILGLEFTGIAEDGKRVMGLVAAGGLATTVRADPLLTWTVPDDWSLREAATVPVVYATAYYALVVRGKLQAGESVLIHAGSGGVGQAAISIALSRGCVVYTTVSSAKKRDFLKQRFPQLQDKNFANSRDSTFEYHILEQTKGKGVNLVLNSLAGDLLQASVRCLKEHGRFLEIGKADLANNTALGMSIFLKNITFHGILLDALFDGTTDKRKELQDLLYSGLKTGEVKPLPLTSFSYDKAEDAFRFMASGKHIGKVVLEVEPEGKEQESQEPEKKSKGKKKAGACPMAKGISSVYRLWPRPDLVYVITGGLGGLGLEVADWLVGRGAQKLVLTSRRGISTGYQALCVKRWRSSGISIRILKHDASTLAGAEKLLQESAAEGPVGGIFHLAMILEDSIIENQSSLTYQRVVRVKADGSKHLDTASRKLCPELHLWVTFSSVACGRGNAGQSNYGWANSVSEKVVERRRTDGLPGCAIQWGGIGDVGVLADTLGDVEVGGTKPQSVRSVLASLDQLIGSDRAVVSSLCLSSSKSSSGRDSKGGKSLMAAVANILGIRDISKAPMNVSLGDFGADSLMAVEIKQTLEREADMILDTEQIKELTLGKLKDMENSEGSSSIAESGDKVSSFSWLDYPLISPEIVKVLNAGDKDQSTAPPLFIASPIQGTCDVLSHIASKINSRVIGLEYPEAVPSTCITSMVAAIINKIEEIHPTGPYHLGGYSFGASVAYEIASQMEKKGRKPLSLVLLDGSHSYVSGIIDMYQNKFATATAGDSKSPSSVDLQVKTQGEAEALVVYTLQFCTVDATQLKESLVRLQSWHDRLSHVAKLIIEETNKYKKLSRQITIEEIMCSASMFFNRLSASYHHDASTAAVSVPTLLIRASQNAHLSVFGKDYGLTKVLKGKLTVQETEGTHESFITGESGNVVTKYINEFLQRIK